MIDPATVRAAADVWRAAAGADIAPLGAGHINDTWLVSGPDGRWVLQRLNGRVFPDPVAVMEKVAAVTAHLRAGGQVRVPMLIETVDGAPFHVHDGEVWRLWEFIAGTRSLGTLTGTRQAEAAGQAFGALQQALSGFAAPVPDPIPGFMQLDHYLALLDAAVAAQGATGAAAAALAEIDARRDLAGLFADRDRLVHGDCKVDNLLYRHRGDEVVAVIDLDTVMRGHWAWDLGDLARSAAATADGFSPEQFAALVRGFRRGVEAALAAEALVLAPRYVTVMLAARFLTDHLNGDRYFKVAARGDNLRRAREQLALLAGMERQARAMRRAAEAA
ncbi:MAG: phosphotransferase [Pseudomonadales bacterium]